MFTVNTTNPATALDRVHGKVRGSRSPIQSISSLHRTTSDRTACVDAEATGDHLHPPARPLFQYAAQGMCGVRQDISVKAGAYLAHQ